MKQLEDKIIRNIYVMETRKMSLSFAAKLFVFLISGAVAFLMTQVLWEFMSEGQTFNVLTIFSDDAEVVRSYFGDIINVIFQETPKGLLAAIVISLVILISVVLTFVFNFGKMRHKLAAIRHYWRQTN